MTYAAICFEITGAKVSAINLEEAFSLPGVERQRKGVLKGYPLLPSPSPSGEGARINAYLSAIRFEISSSYW
jgi:hypothetical protein